MRKYLLALFILACSAWAANVKLYMKDGSYHVVREYQVQGDRVHFYSIERSDWEDIPVDLIDLKRTQSEAAERQERLESDARSQAAEEKALRDLESTRADSRIVGRVDRSFDRARHHASAAMIERGVIDGVEWINPSNDIKVGLQDVFKFYSIQGLHQAIDIADVIFNGAKWRSLPPDLQAIVEVALTASLFEAMLFFAHENAKALVLIKAKGVTMFDAPPDYAPAFIKSSKKVLAALEAKDPFFKKVLESQRAYANVVVPYTRETSKLSTLISGAAAM